MTAAFKLGLLGSIEAISAVAEVLAGRSDAKFTRLGIKDRFGVSGKPADLFAEFGLTPADIVAAARSLIG